MNQVNMRNAISQYAQVGAQTAIEAADAHRLVQMLMEGALDKLAIARGHMTRGNVAEKGAHISWAISIIGGLQASLNPEAGGDLADNLDGLYEYMARRLLESSMNSDVEILDEVIALLGSVKEAWDSIPEDSRQPPVAAAVGQASL